MLNHLDVLEYSGEGYSRVVSGAKWTVASLNYAPRFDEKNIADLERHNLTDEARSLLERGEVKCEAACDYATDGSGYGVMTKSVPLLIVEDRAFGSRAGLFPAEGRFGGGFCGWMGAGSTRIPAECFDKAREDGHELQLD